MSDIYINPNWTFKETIENVEVIKSQMGDIIAFFWYFDLKKEVDFIRNLKKQIYSLKFEEWKRDKIWEYLNDYENLEILLKFI